MTRVTVQLQVPINVEVEVDELTENKILDAAYEVFVGKGYSGLLSKFYSDRLVILIPGVFILVLCTIVVHMAFRGQSSIGYIWLVEAANLSVDESYELAISCFSSWIFSSFSINS